VVPEVGLYVAGKRKEGIDKHRLVSPVNGEHVATIALPGPADIEEAIAAARTAQADLAEWSPFERAALCHRIADGIETRIKDIAHIQTLEQGKPLTESVEDIEECVEYFRNAAEDAKRLKGDVIPTTDRNQRMFTFRRPVGVWANISPWNFPVMIPVEYLAPALATGNTMICKPPEFTAWALLALAEVFEEAGVPKGAISILPGGGEVGRALVTHPGIAAVAFTGSNLTGKQILAEMGIKRSIMEMSGNGPLIVSDDANLEAAAAAAVYGAYYNAGQVCCATERVIVLESIHDQLVAATLEAAKAVRLGDPFDPETTMGPLCNEATAAKMDRHVADAQARGAELLTGGARAEGFPTSLYYELTVLDRVPEASLVAQEESFGPVVPVLTVANDAEAAALANRSHLGLQAAVFTSQIDKAFWYADHIRSGTVVVNDSTDFWETFQPFGGAAGTETGWGRQRIEEFTDLQTVVFNLTGGEAPPTPLAT